MYQTMVAALYYIALVAIPAAILYCFMKYKHTYWKRRGIRSVPNPHWLFGHLKDSFRMKTSSSVAFGELYQQGNDDDDVLGIYIFHQPFLLLRNLELIKQIMIKDFNVFPNHYFSAKSVSDKVGSSNLFAIDYPEWKYLRIKMTPVFTSGKVKKLFNLMVETSKSLHEHFENLFANGSKTKAIVTRDVLMRYTTDIISSVAFGVGSNSFTEPPPEFYTKSLESSRLTFVRALRFLCMFFFPNFAKYLGGRMLGSSTEYFRAVFWDSMDTREASNAKRGDLIDSLLELKNDKQENDFEFEGDALLAQSAIFFVAGRETTVTTVTFCLCELAKNPEIQKRTREEIMEKLEKHGMTYESVHEMKYLFQVISETLRLYPPAPLIDRVAVQDYKIPGSDIVIEKGMPVYVALRGLHLDPRYHPDPMRFDPDRFSEERKNDIKQCSYMPFGEGPRVCIGLRVGLLQAAVGLITILKDYEVSLHPLHKCEVDPRNVFTTPPQDFQLNFTRLAKVE